LAYPAPVAQLDVPGLWRTYGRHAEAMLSGGPSPATTRSDAHFLILSGVPDVELNQAVIFGDGDRRTAGRIVAAVQASEMPCLLGVSSTVRDDVADTLRFGGFEALPIREAMFYAEAPPAVGPSAFQVRQVRTTEDHAGAQHVLLGAHDYHPDLVAAMWGPALLERPDVGCWVAWDGDDPVSCVYLTRVGRSLGVHRMMTPPRHRRRGAGRAVLANALVEAWTWEGTDADYVAFWASPAGRPLYESMGFTVADDVDAWMSGATPEDLVAVGAG
jgi:GNAT superfamily N-acetyltransferase